MRLITLSNTRTLSGSVLPTAGAAIKLLLVEDDPKAVAFLQKGLSEGGFVVDPAANGDDGLALARTGCYAVIVLDVMLLGRDGWDVLAELRRGGDTTPVLFLTARDGIADRLKGLDLGADDYILKPFAFAPSSGPARVSDVIRVADLEIDLVRHRACRGEALLDGGHLKTHHGREWLRCQSRSTAARLPASKFGVRPPRREMLHEVDRDHRQ